jgi:subtilisin family serine protease
MRMHSRRAPGGDGPPVRRRGIVLLAGLVAALVAGGTAGGAARTAERQSAASWRGLVGDPQAPVAVGQRMIVVLKTPSLGDRVAAAAGGRASDAQERRWTEEARDAQRLFVERMNERGARIRREHIYLRVLNGFSAPLDPGSIALLERATEVEGIYPIRAAFPATTSAPAAFARGAAPPPDVRLPGFTGRGVTVALLDTGVDRQHRYLRGRIQAGFDLLDGNDDASALPHPENGLEYERHGTELAGLIVGAGGPRGLAGVAPGASILPIRIGGWQRDARGAWRVFSRTDLVLAGLERAVDPDGNGDAHDGAAIAVVGMAERFAGFGRGPLARAAAGALRLDTLVVAPAGNDGPLGPGFGSIAGPGGAPAALTVGAADLRASEERIHVVLRAGLNVVVDRLAPLGGVVAPERSLTLPLATPRVADVDARPVDQAAGLSLPDFFDESGLSLVAGRAALVPAGDEATRGLVEAAARAGAAAVVVYGGVPLPGGSLGLDERVPVPVVGVDAEAGRTLQGALADGADVALSLGRVEAVEEAERVAAFSSRGLAFDGRVKPELVAAGVGLPTSDPGVNDDGSPRFRTINGTSASAAVVAGAAALLAQARPELRAEQLKGLLVGAAAGFEEVETTAQGAGLLDVRAAARRELSVTPATLAYPRATRENWRVRNVVAVTNVSTRRLRVRPAIELRGFAAADPTFTVTPEVLVLPPGETGHVRVIARVESPPPAGPPAEGALVLRPRAGAAVRVPFAISFARRRINLLGEPRLEPDRFEPSNTTPAVLSVQVGLLGRRAGNEEIQPVERLEVELWTATGRRMGVLARLRNVLPGHYSFGITGRDPGGGRLRAGSYRLQLVATPPGGGSPTIRSIEFTIE